MGCDQLHQRHEVPAGGRPPVNIFSSVNDEIGEIIVADVDGAFVAALVVPGSPELSALIGGH